MRRFIVTVFLMLSCSGHAAAASTHADLIIRNGMIYDGTGAPPFRGDIAVSSGRVLAVGALTNYSADEDVDAHGLAVAPGFINVLSWALDSLMYDGRGMSDLMQGVTLEVFGEGDSWGPINDIVRAEMIRQQKDIHYPITWNTLGEFLDRLVAKGVSVNVASFVGAATVRSYELGLDNRQPAAAELGRMEELVRQAMREGALGVGSALIYAPGSYANTDELVALVRAAGEYGGVYISHIRNEGDNVFPALAELIDIARKTKVHAEVYHLKVGGEGNWPKMRQVIGMIEAARAEGLSISANMYPYTAGSTGLEATMPPWVQEGGLDAWIGRLKDPEIRQRVLREMRTPSNEWESLLLTAGSADRVLMIGFKSDYLKPLTGKTLAQIAKMRGTSAEDAAIDLVVEDHSHASAAYFTMSEANVTLGLRQPWVAIGSDEGALAPEGIFLRSSPHPRAYGTFARFLGRYVRDLKVATLTDAIRRVTRLPAENFHLHQRGCLDEGCHADIVIFDPAAINDRATFENPRRYATGMVDVYVNGVRVLKSGKHTGAMPGQVVRGPGWTGWQATNRTQ